MKTYRRNGFFEGLRIYPWCMIGHIAQGAVAGSLILFGGEGTRLFGLGWLALFACYQGLSVLRKEDSPGLDIADFMAGFIAALAAPALIWLWG